VQPEEQPPSPPPVPPPGENGPVLIPVSPSQDGLGGWLNPRVGRLLFATDYKVTGFPNEPVAGQGTQLGYMQQDLGLVLPCWQDECNEWSATANVRGEIFHTGGTILPTTGQPFPQELWNIRLGTTYRHLFDNGWIAGASVTFGSASDKPFASINEMTAAATAFLRIPQGEHNAWLFTLNYSTNSEVLSGIPIPGVAYFYAPTPWFQATIGFPFASATIRPTDDLTFQFSYALLRTVHARVIYRLAPQLRVYSSFDMANENYFLEERLDDRERFFYYDTRASAGVQWNFWKNWVLDAAGGYVFDRYYFEGRTYNDRNFNRVDVGDGPFASVQFKVKF
jgi:hypothetical protein